MSNPPMRSSKISRARSRAPKLDKCLFVPIAACTYALIVSPLLMYMSAAPSTGLSAMAKLESLMAPRPENKIVWPILAAIAVGLVLRNWSRLSLSPHMIFLGAYLGFAGASILWAFKPEFSLNRFVLQLMIVSSIILPALVADRTSDMMRGVFICFSLATILNLFFVLDQTPIDRKSVV